MNALLEKAFAAVAQLPDTAQETIASLILDEIEAERGWDERFGKSQDQLGELVRLGTRRSGAGRRAPLRSRRPSDEVISRTTKSS